MKKIILSAILILFVQFSFAVPPMPGVKSVRNGDGTYIDVRIFGDDFFHYTLTADGYLIGMPAEGPNKGFYVYAYTDAKGDICLTDERVGAPLTKSSKRQAGMPQYVKEIANARIEAMQRMQPQGLLTGGDTDGQAIQRAPSAITERRGLVLLVEFPDLPFSHTNADFSSMMNQKGYSKNGGVGSAADYFNDNALGKATFKFDVVGPIKVSKPYAYYGENGTGGYDKNPAELCAEAVQLAVKNFGTDVSLYDQDNNGDIDMVFYFFAGHGEAQGASANHIWPHKSTVYAQYINGVSDVVNGKNIRTYACASELKGNSGTNMDGIGTFCHEFSHVLGLTDIYDTDGDTNGKCVGMGAYSLMDGGTYNLNSTTPPYYMAFERAIVGWLDNKDITVDKDEYKICVLKNVRENDGVTFRTATTNLTYYVEARKKTGWDAGIPGEGVLVYLIDKSNRKVASTGRMASQLWYENKPNSSPDAPCAMILHANNATQKGNASTSIQKGWIYPSSSNKEITPTSKPSSVSRYSDSDFFYITNIAYNSDGTASFTFGENKLDFTKEFPLVSIKVPQGGFTTSSTLELIDPDKKSESVVWYINGVKGSTLIKGSNVEIKADVKMNDGTSQVLYKYYNL